MRIAWAIPCRYVEVVNGLATIVGGGANIWTIPAGMLPQPLGVTVAVQLAGAEGELAEEHHLRGQILGPDMQPVGDALDVPGLVIPPGEMKPPGWEGTMIVPIVMQWTVEEPGTYTLDFSIDGRSTTVAILVNEGTPPPPPAA